MMYKSLLEKRQIKWRTFNEGELHPRYNGGAYVDDKGYLRVLRPEHPHANRGYVYMHRLVMEKYLGRNLESWEVVHHINEIKLDNRPENLFLTTSPEHSAIHRNFANTTAKKRSGARKRQKAVVKDKMRGSHGRFVSKD